MKGTTNSKLTSSLKEIVNVNLSTNQNDSSDLIGAIITVEYGGEFKNFIWNGELLNVEVPEGFDYTVSVGEVDNYKAPSPVSYSAEGNSFTSVNFQYLTELVTITVTTEDGASANGSIINCNGANHTYNGVFTKKFAYGTTYTITPNNFGDYSADPITYTANQVSREISIVYSLGFPAGTTFEFDYTGTVQEVELKKGTYKLQCWGAQGGNVTGTYAVNGSKGGYSEGELTLTEGKKLYVFVGGQGTAYTSSETQTSTSIVNGGWNGGGAGRRTSSYYSNKSFPRGGGGGTDIALETSTMNYSSGRTTRNSASLLSRIIVAGGGAGASAYYKTETIYSLFQTGLTSGTQFTTGNHTRFKFENGSDSQVDDSFYEAVITWYGDFDGTQTTTVSLGEPFDIPSGTSYGIITSDPADYIIDIYAYDGTTTSSGKATTSKQGGGTSGKGQYPGTQTSAGSGGGFGLGAILTSTNYGYCAGGGGGGWYGGGTSQSNSSTSYINYSGGGSGFVNIASNAKYRPTGYTGLQLDSGQTIAGNKSFESPTGGTETGHSGNGYARITVL